MMRALPSSALPAVLTLAGMLSLSGCKSNNTPANQNPQTAQQPASGQPDSSASSASSAPPASASGAQSGAQAPQAPPPPAVVELPAGTSLRVRLDSDLGSKISQPGDSFTATIADEVLVNGQTIIHKGARAEGTVIDAKPLGKFKGGAVLSIRLERVHTKWGSYPVATSSIERAEKGKGKRSAGFIGGGQAVGGGQLQRARDGVASASQGAAAEVGERARRNGEFAAAVDGQGIRVGEAADGREVGLVGQG